MCCLFTLKHGPEPSLPSIHLPPPSRRYQLEETDVSSCFTSWLNFSALWCFFLSSGDFIYLLFARNNRNDKARMDFKSLCSLATEPLPASPRKLLEVSTNTPVKCSPCGDCLTLGGGCKSGGGGVTSGFKCPSGRWWARTKEGGRDYG